MVLSQYFIDQKLLSSSKNIRLIEIKILFHEKTSQSCFKNDFTHQCYPKILFQTLNHSCHIVLTIPCSKTVRHNKSLNSIDRFKRSGIFSLIPHLEYLCRKEKQNTTGKTCFHLRNMHFKEHAFDHHLLFGTFIRQLSAKGKEIRAHSWLGTEVQYITDIVHSIVVLPFRRPIDIKRQS